MLIRFVIKNLFSFKELTSFDMLPGRSARMPHHVYDFGSVQLLKLNAMYGANGAGKSNLIKAFTLLKEIVVTGKLPIEFLVQTFKFDTDSKDKELYLGVEFIKDDIPYYYGLTIHQGIIIEEELQISGLGVKEDYVLFLRTDSSAEKNIEINFCKEIMDNPETALFPKFLKNEVLERSQPVLFHMASRKHEIFSQIKKAFEWFNNDVIPITPSLRPAAISLELENDKQFFKFANQTMASFNTGTKSLEIATIPIEDFFGEEDKERAERIASELKANPNRAKFIRTKFEEILFVRKDDKTFAKRLYFIQEINGHITKFTADEVSDGTRRLLDYLPVFYSLISSRKVFLIDEIERSLHPLLIKALINKFSNDEYTNGQLIFSTHESNLLDQSIFRSDEIWFVERNKNGATEIYSLHEFKEHHTISIRNGYMNGRYGGIPFLGNLQDLNWDQYAKTH